MRTKKTARRSIDSDDFYTARRRAGLTVERAAEMLQVNPRTIRNWENNTSQIPYAAFRLMRLFGGHNLMHSAWEGWSIYRGELVSPTGRSFAPYQLIYLSNYLLMAKAWLHDRENPKPLAPLVTAAHAAMSPGDTNLTPSHVAPSVREEASSATALSGSGLPHGQVSRDSNVVSLQGKPISLAKLEKYFEIGSIGEAANDVLELEVE